MLSLLKDNKLITDFDITVNKLIKQGEGIKKREDKVLVREKVVEEKGE